MKRNQLISYSAILLATILTFGCSTSDRVEGSVGISDPNDNGSNFMNDNNSTNNDENTTIGTIKIDAKNAYKVTVSFSDEYNQRGYYSRDEVGELKFDIKNLYDNLTINTSLIEWITLEAEEKDDNNNLQGKYFNFIQFDGKQSGIYTITDDDIKSADTVALKMENLSGTTNIILSVKLKDITNPYKLKIPLVIEKNKSSSMAIVPYDSRYENGLFIDKFVIHVVDSYGNKAKDGTRISTGVINNPKLYSYSYDPNTNNFLNDIGTLDKNNSIFKLPTNSIDTDKDLVTSLDTLITLANQNQHKPENLGGWDITSINSDSEISIINFDKGDNIENVSYVIGDEYRYDSCHNTIMNAASSTFESTEVKDGIAYAELRYVPAMVGKTIFIYANTRLEDKHIGISRRVSLTGTGLKPVTVSCTNNEGKNPTCEKVITLIQNDSEKFARMASIAYPVNSGDAEHANIQINNGSNYQTSCNGNIHIRIDNIDENKTATYTLGTIASELIINQK